MLPDFEDRALAGILRADVDRWEKKERALYAASSVKTWRSTLHLIFEDAVDEGLITSNPAVRRRGRGKRAGRSRDRGPEKVITDPLGILLTAERAARLSGRDDEFVATVLKGYTGMRWGEIIGLETGFVRPDAVRVEWQLYELDTGKMVRCPPKDDSYRTIDSCDWLSSLVLDHIARTKPTPMPLPRPDVRVPKPGLGTNRRLPGRQAGRCRSPRRSLDRHGLQRAQPPRPRT